MRGWHPNQNDLRLKFVVLPLLLLDRTRTDDVRRRFPFLEFLGGVNGRRLGGCYGPGFVWGFEYDAVLRIRVARVSF